MFNWNKKEAPLKALAGLGGGIGRGGGADSPGPIHSASGASIFDVESSDRAVIQFNSPGNITFNSSVANRGLRIILLGGGGSGSVGNAGGGGAGGMIEVTDSSITSGSYAITIGAGANGINAPNNNGKTGSNSTFGSDLTAYGGGAGGAQSEPSSPGYANGGCGGGMGYGEQDPASANQPGFSIPGSYTGNNYGFGGGIWHTGYSCSGGGGIGSIGSPNGSPPASNTARRQGGSGRTIPAPNFPGVPFSGSTVGGGGGGADRYDAGANTAGPGGGGQGCSCNDGIPDDPSCNSGAANGTANTGGGGGGSRCSGDPPGNGGSGLCIISYSLTA